MTSHDPKVGMMPLSLAAASLLLAAGSATATAGSNDEDPGAIVVEQTFDRDFR